MSMSHSTLQDVLGIGFAIDGATANRVLFSDGSGLLGQLASFTFDEATGRMGVAGADLSGPLRFTGDAHAGVELNSITTAQRDALTPANGMVLYNETQHQVQARINGAWVDLAAAPATTDNVPEGATNLYFTEARVLGTDLAGLDTGLTGAITATDTALTAFGRMQNQLNAITGDFVDVIGDTMTGALVITPSTEVVALTINGASAAGGSGSSAPNAVDIIGGTGGSSAVFNGGAGASLNFTAGAGGDSTDMFSTGGPGGSIVLTPGSGGSGPLGNGSSGVVSVSGNFQVTGGATIIGAAAMGQLSINGMPANTSALYTTGFTNTGADTTPMFDLYGTWNTSGAPTSIRLNMTDTASASSGTYLMDLGVGGGSYVSKWWVDKVGKVRQTGGLVIALSPTDVSAMAVTGYSLTGSNANSMFDLDGTWNTTGTPTAFKLNILDTASNANSLLMDLRVGSSSKWKVDKTGNTTQAGVALAPSGSSVAPAYSFSGSTSSGMFLLSAIGLSISGVTGVIVRSSEIIIPTTSRYTWGNTSSYASDLFLERDAANTLALRNSTAAQLFHIYNTFTDASNYERAALRWSSNVFEIRALAAGTGSARDIRVNEWTFKSTGHLLAAADNTYDIGASGATRPKDIYAAGVIVAGGALISSGGTSTINQVQLASGLALLWQSRSRILSPGDGIIQLVNNAITDFSRLQFGGTTSAFPALKRSSTALHVRLADDSDYTLIAASVVQAFTSVNWASGGNNLVKAYAASDGVLRLVDGLETSFGRLQFGGTTSSYPALKRSSATLQVRLADDSAYAAFRALQFETDATGIGFFNAAPVAQQVSGADLTNSVASGGTDDTIANFADLTTYSNDAATIRDNIYQLARKLKQVNDALRDYGLLT